MQPETQTQITSSREILVLIRGFIFVGDVTETPEGIWCRNAHNIRMWERNGFGGMTADPKAAGALLDATKDFFVPNHPQEAQVLQRVPVSADWGEELV